MYYYDYDYCCCLAWLPACTVKLRTKVLDLRGFYSSGILIVQGWNYHFQREIPGKFEASNLSGDNCSREIGRTLFWHLLCFPLVDTLLFYVSCFMLLTLLLCGCVSYHVVCVFLVVLVRHLSLLCCLRSVVVPLVECVVFVLIVQCCVVMLYVWVCVCVCHHTLQKTTYRGTMPVLCCVR